MNCSRKDCSERATVETRDASIALCSECFDDLCRFTPGEITLGDFVKTSGCDDERRARKAYYTALFPVRSHA